MAFKYVDAESVTPLIKGKVTGWRATFLDRQLEILSARLNAWYPTLKKQWEESEKDSELRGLVDIMVTEAARKLTNNPEMMSSETAGPFAYSRFDSEDPYKNLFMPRDVQALEELLSAATNQQVGAIKMSIPYGVAKPLSRPGKRAFGRPRW